MPHHVHLLFPCGLRVAADWREPVVKPMRRYLREVAMDGKWPPRKTDVDAILAWYEMNREQSRLCYQRKCGHD